MRTIRDPNGQIHILVTMSELDDLRAAVLTAHELACSSVLPCECYEQAKALGWIAPPSDGAA
jgi:Iap family predicted aminopeptidase